jgi:argonaute-like protein implicated in RNA metabolism and viral defense
MSSASVNHFRKRSNTQLKVVEQEAIKAETNEDYISGAESLGAKSERRGQKPDVVIVYLAKGTSNFELDTPYYNTKPVLLKHDIASQMVTQLALNDSRWIHANLASAIFAKAGGHPWVLAKDIADFDMIMGVALSESISKTKRAGARTRYLGYANVFDEQGRWMFFESTALIYDSRTHAQQLSDLVDLSVERFRKARGHYPRSIAIHYYKRFGWREIDKVMEGLDAKTKGSRVAFITIDKSHPMRLYDVRTPDGSYPRAHYAQTFENEFLLSTTGHTELAKKRKGTPAILKVTVKQRPEPFVSLESVAEQILALTRLNHKTLTPIVGEPVTLLYANLVASFTAVFSEGQWKDAQAGEMHKLNTVPWFL